MPLPDPLARLYEIEAVADQRIDNDMCALSKLTKIAALAREMIGKITGSTDNPIWPKTPRR
jgi:hypothetical protein